MSSTKKPATFDAAVERTLGEALRVVKQRGDSYGDTWLNPVTIFSAGTERFLAKIKRTVNYTRAMFAAHMIDVKLSRIPHAKEFQEDTIDDLINYLAAYKVFMKGALET